MESKLIIFISSFLVIFFSSTESINLDKKSFSNQRPLQLFPDRSTNTALHSFSHEAITPQKVTTGCEGLRFPNGEAKTDYYIIDASGRKKYVRPGSFVEVVFPGPKNFPELQRVRRVYFDQICFHESCRALTCGNTVGPVASWSKGKH